jgi:hypothetical protein
MIGVSQMLKQSITPIFIKSSAIIKNGKRAGITLFHQRFKALRALLAVV